MTPTVKMAKKKSEPKDEETAEEFPAGNYDDSVERDKAIAEAEAKPEEKTE